MDHSSHELLFPVSGYPAGLGHTSFLFVLRHLVCLGPRLIVFFQTAFCFLLLRFLSRGSPIDPPSVLITPLVIFVNGQRERVQSAKRSRGQPRE